MVEQPCRLGGGGAVGLLLSVVLGDLVDERLEVGTALRCTGGGDLGVLRGRGVDAGGICSDGVGQRVLCSHRSPGRPSGRRLTGAGAGDGGRVSDAAGVKADDVVGRVEIGRELLLVVLHHLHSGVAGATRIGEEAALAHRAGGHVLLHGDLNGLTVGLGVVQRHLDLRTLEGRRLRGLLHPTGFTAVVPLHRLVVKGLQALGNRRLRSNSRSRPRRRNRRSRNRTDPHTQTHAAQCRQHPSSHPTAPGPSSASVSPSPAHHRRNDIVPRSVFSYSRLHGQHRMNRSYGL